MTIQRLRKRLFRFLQFLFYFRQPVLPAIRAIQFSDGGQQLLWINWQNTRSFRIRCKGYRVSYLADETNFLLLPLKKQKRIHLKVRSLWRKNNYTIQLSDTIVQDQQPVSIIIQTKNLQPLTDSFAVKTNVTLPSFIRPVVTFSTISHLENLKYEKGIL
ncbi:hypothetical protein JMG10_05840 [Nostoc ellipsosporum NOK]|nr:hypothetical protein [Nostoc ellipsosporum NOK]